MRIWERSTLGTGTELRTWRLVGHSYRYALAFRVRDRKWGALQPLMRPVNRKDMPSPLFDRLDQVCRWMDAEGWPT